MTLELFHQPAPQFFILDVPAPAGMSDSYMRLPAFERAVEPLIPRSRHSGPQFVIPAKSRPRTPIRGRNPEGSGEGIVARGLVPRLGRAASSPALHHPAPSHFHPLMRPSQGHDDSRERGNPGEGRTAHPCHIESLWAGPPQPTVLVRSQFANAQDKLRSNLNSSRNIALNTVQ